jgi:TonB family protein
VSAGVRRGFLYLWLVAGLAASAIRPLHAVGEGKGERKLKVQVAPVYPELARRLAVTGSVKVQVTIAPGGAVKQAKLVGGHPLLVDPVMDAVKRWKYEPGPSETVQLVEVKFTPQR